MKIVIAGIDRTADIGAAVRAQADASSTTGPLTDISAVHGALQLARAGSGQEYVERYLFLAGMRDGVKLDRLAPPLRPGPLGRIFAFAKTALWKLLSFRIGEIVRRQNFINHMLCLGLQAQNRELNEQLARITSELRELRNSLREAPPGGDRHHANSAPRPHNP